MLMITSLVMSSLSMMIEVKAWVSGLFLSILTSLLSKDNTWSKLPEILIVVIVTLGHWL